MEEQIVQLRGRLEALVRNQDLNINNVDNYAERLRRILEMGIQLNEENAENVTNRFITSEHPPIPMADDNNNRDTNS
jgi:hypothetical protein